MGYMETPPVCMDFKLVKAVCEEFVGELFRGGGGCNGVTVLSPPLSYQLTRISI